MQELLSDWRFWLTLTVVIVLLYIARPYLHRVLKAIFFGISHLLHRVAIWCARSGQVMIEQYAETVAAHRTQEYHHRLERHSEKIHDRASIDTGTVMQTAGQLEMGVASIESAAITLSGINLPEETTRAVQSAVAASENAKQSVRTVQAVKTALSAKVQEIRPELIKVRKEIPNLRRNIERLHETERKLTASAKSINDDLEKFEEAIHSPDRMAVAEKESIVIPWILALLVMAIALCGVFLNFFLIQRPMAEIVGDDMRVVGMSLPTVAAIVVIFLEAAAGIVLMESLRITHLMKISELNDKMRRIFLVASVVTLLGFSAFEVLLAFTRESLIELDQQTQEMAQSTSPVLADAIVEAPEPDAGGSEAADTEEDGHRNAGFSMALWAQVILAFIIPWLLATAAIPLERVVQNLWFILRLVVHQLLMFLSVLCRMLATVIRSLGVFVLRLYDLIIFLPLAIEEMVRKFRESSRSSGAT